MKDPRGVNRGKCSKCPCTDYEYEEGAKRADCTYCSCPAPAHEEITDDRGADHNSSNSIGLNESTGGNSSNNSDLASSQIIIELPSGQDSFLSSLLDRSGSTVSDITEPTSDEIANTFPKKFPKDVMTALQTKSVTAVHKKKIVQDVVTNLCQNDYTSNKCMEKAARKLGEKYSPFKQPLLDPDYKHLTTQLKRRRNRAWNKSEKEKEGSGSGTSTAEHQISPAEAKERMLLDWASGVKSITSYRQNMFLTKAIRVKEAKTSPGILLLRHFPALQLTELLLEEFLSDIQMTKAQVESNWSNALPHISGYMTEKKILESSENPKSFGEQTVEVLELFHKIPLWYKAKMDNNRAAKVLETFPENTTANEMRPNGRDPPRLLVVKTDGKFSISCYLDTMPFFTSEDPVLSLLYLLAMYFVFDIKWPTNCRLPFVTLAACTIGAAKVATHIGRNNLLKDLLSKWNIPM